MAGEAVLSAFMQVLFEKLYTAAIDELRSLRSVGKELDDLSRTLSMIQGFLDDAEKKQLKNKPVRVWLTRLKDVAYDMDELLAEYEAGRLRSELEGQTHIPEKVKVSSRFSCSCWYADACSSHYRLAHRIKAIREALDKIARERHILGLRVSGNSSRLEITERPQTSSLVDWSNVFGREEDRENIVQILLSNGNSSIQNVSILPIVGMGGLGKTTLTQLVYNDSRIRAHFELMMWVCVSENFDEMKLTKETLESLTSGSATSGYSAITTNMNLVQENLSNRLRGKLFLLVLDDVWNEDHTKWSRFSKALTGGAKGSKVIVTTQNENVGRIMGGLPPYRLERLTDSDCWNLFRNCAFVDGISSGHPNLERIGKAIVTKLKGLPLTAKALGSLLYSKLGEDDWKNILRSEIWELPSDETDILPALRLSYKHLPPHLRQCFAFCSVFHKDYVFDKEKLVQIWMALGYIQPQGRRRLEDIGNSYFDDLVSRSFFQPRKTYYVMHDAIHDLARSISIGECASLEDGSMGQIVSMRQDGSKKRRHRARTPCPRTRHISYSCDNSEVTSLEPFSVLESLRTLLLLRGERSRVNPIPDSLFLKLSCLRVLELNRRDITTLPSSIGNLIQLRYLCLSGTGIQKLPTSVGKLYSLQTLKLKDCYSLKEIPEGVTNLIYLRHLEANSRLISKIARIGRLTHLQELEEFTVRSDSRYKIRELKDMTELRGQLCIQNLENVVSGEEASEAELSTKEYLSLLHFIWADDHYVSLQDECRDEEVLEGLKPHTELRELKIKGYAGVKFPGWLGNPSFCCLQTIHLSGCRNCQVLPSLGQLPLLRNLTIASFGVVRIGQEFSGIGEVKGFPSLNELVLEDMPDLEEWLSAEEETLFPCLTDLEIVDCPKLRQLPCLPPTLTRLIISEAGLNSLPPVRDTDITVPLSLSSFCIQECPNLTSLQQGLLSQQLKLLKELTLTDCGELISLPVGGFRHLVSLKSLNIYNCSKLSIQEGEGSLLPSLLEDLRISSCTDLINPILQELRTLSCLKHLKIGNFPYLYYLPEQWLPPTLQFLGIMDCARLQSLPAWMRELSSLETLSISNCPQISSLPENGLPEMLQELVIRECPSLKKQLRDDPGRDRRRLTHIPSVEIDGELITSERRGLGGR